MEELTVVRKRIEVAGGQVVTVARFRGEDGGTAFVLHKGWSDEAGPVLQDEDGVLALDAETAAEVADALAELGDGP